MKPVSVIIPVYNAEATLAQCLDSVLAQTFCDFELICVDDGSTDSSSRILVDYASRDERMVIVSQSNQGISGARNAGYDVSSGEFVLFLDADDYFEPTYIAKAHAQGVIDDADVVVVKFRYAREDGISNVESAGSLRTDLLPAVPFTPDDAQGTLFRLTTPCVWNKLFRRTFLINEGLRFETSLTRAEDVPFTFASLMLARRITVVDEVMVNYRTGGAESLQSTIDEDPLAICRALLIVKEIAVRRGVFERFERDLVNASVEQCLFALGSMRSSDAAKQLFGALRDRYLIELGAAGRDDEYFYNRLNRGRAQAILDGTIEDYWFAESARLRSELRSTSDRISTQYAKLRSLQETNKTVREDLSTVTARAQAAERRRSQTMNRMISRARALRAETLVLNGQLADKRARLSATRDASQAIRNSRIYRVARWTSSLMPGMSERTFKQQGVE